MNIRFGDASREIRKTLGITQREMAAALGMTASNLCKWESSNKQPTPALIAKYHKAWGVDLYVFAWCRHGDLGEDSELVRGTAGILGAGLKLYLLSDAIYRKAKGG